MVPKIVVALLCGLLAGCGGSDPTTPQVITQCQDTTHTITVTCGPDAAPTASASASGGTAGTTP